MGIVNVTPDSFSDGGQFLDARAAVAHALATGRAGRGDPRCRRRIHAPGRFAGGRGGGVAPGAAGDRAIGGASAGADLDRHHEARRGPGRAGGRGEHRQRRGRQSRRTRRMWRVVAEARAGYVCMHMQGTPQTMQANPVYADVVREVGEFFLRAPGAIERLRSEPGASYTRPRDRLWQDARAQFAVARGGAEFYKVWSARCCWVSRASPLLGSCWARNWRRGCRGRWRAPAWPSPRGRKSSARMMWRRPCRRFG